MCRRAAFAEMHAAAARNKAAHLQQENRLAGVLAGGPQSAYQRMLSQQAGKHLQAAMNFPTSRRF